MGGIQTQVIPVEQIVEEAAPYTDILERETLATYIQVFTLAHVATPGGVSLEVGTRAGGSALMFLQTLKVMYEEPPLLVTVDPYGEKPYPRGVIDPLEYKYGDDYYLTAKKLLAPFPNHLHFNIRSEDFWKLKDVPVWRDGSARSLTDLTFAFLDGDHSPHAIVVDSANALQAMRPGGILLIDNVDWTLNDVTGVIQTMARLVERGKRWAAFQK